MGAPVDYIIVSFIFISLFLSQSGFEKFFKLPQIKFLLVFLLIIFLSNIVNGNFDAAITYTIKFSKFVLFFLCIALSINSFSKLKVLTIFMIMLIAFIGFQCIIQVQTGTNWAGQVLYWGGRARWVGLFDGSNITALTFTFSISFLLVYLFDRWNIGYKIFAITSGCFILTGFYLADSRGGFVSLLAVSFSFIILKLKNKKGIIIATILILLLFTVASPSRMSEIDDPHRSTKGRISAWDESFQMIRYHNPLFGVGKGQFTKYTRKIAHNAFLQQIGETGLIGAFFWIGIIYATFKGLIKVIKEKHLDSFRFSLYKAYLIGFIGLLVGMMFISSDNEFLFNWMALCTSIILMEGVEIRLTSRDLKIIGGIEIAGLTVMYIMLKLFDVIYS